MKNSLLRKGFRADNSHHEMLWFYAGHKKTSIRTRFSHGKKEYDDSLCGMVRQQIKLQTPAEFKEFMDCSMDYNRYLAILKSRGHVIEEEPQPVASPPRGRKK